MSEIYTIIIVILAILAVSGLFVGVTNDAVNFLNSAIGSRAASMRMILLVASVGILVGVVTSSGMMEVARNGMFNPGLFTFHEVMMLYLGVMFANIILLDLYNSWGLPTSTTVSLVFCLLGAAIAVTVYKITGSADAGHEMGEYINTSRALGIVSAILLSVVIAFTCGTAVMYVSRLIFSFRYTRVFSRFGAFWCGASLTAIVYFALFKGLRNILEGHDFIRLVDSHLPLALTICWAVCSLLLLADESEESVADYAGRGTTYAACRSGQILGQYVLLHTRPFTAEVVNIAVAPEYQRRGIATALLQHAVRTARDAGFRLLEIGTGDIGAGQIALYERCGFVRCASTKTTSGSTTPLRFSKTA